MKQKIVAMMVALAASLGAIETWEDPVTGYTWWYRIVGETVNVQTISDMTGAFDTDIRKKGGKSTCHAA